MFAELCSESRGRQREGAGSAPGVFVLDEAEERGPAWCLEVHIPDASCTQRALNKAQSGWPKVRTLP